jgi:hypothetical protein
VGAVILIGLREANTKGEPPGGTTPEITGIAITGEAHDTSMSPVSNGDSIHGEAKA